MRPEEAIIQLEPLTKFEEKGDLINAPMITNEKQAEAIKTAIEALSGISKPAGEWIKCGAYYDERAKAMFDKCKCSICGITQSFYEDNETGELYSFIFCPNCGSQMLGGEKE